MSLANRDANDEHNQHANHRGNREQVLFQRLKIVKMKINGEPDQHNVVLRFALQRRRS